MTKNAAQKSLQNHPEGFPEDYHDYIFKDGKLVGDFDNMYRYAKGIPWDQDKHCERWYTEVGMLMLRDRGPYESILEVGCGLGFIARKLKEATRSGKGVVDAFDVSPEAIGKASRLHTGVAFYVDNIVNHCFRPRQQYDLVVVKDVFWYVFEHMETVVRNLKACVRPGGHLYIGQSFPDLNSAFVGKKIIPNPEALIAYLSDYQPVFTALLRNHTLSKDGPTLHFLGLRTR